LLVIERRARFPFLSIATLQPAQTGLRVVALHSTISNTEGRSELDRCGDRENMSTSTQSQPPKHKPRSSKVTPLKAVAKPQSSGLSLEEIRHIIEVIG
jgi:hypothetical protein